MPIGTPMPLGPVMPGTWDPGIPGMPTLDRVVTAAKKSRYRNRVSVLVVDSSGRVLVSMKEPKRPDLPGGGTDQQKINTAAAREVLEEVGWKVTDVAPLRGVSSVEFLWPADFKAKQRAKGRTHDGFRNHYRWARATKRDKRLYNEADDAKTHLKFMSIDALIRIYRAAARRKNNEWKQMDRANVQALQALQRVLDEEAT